MVVGLRRVVLAGCGFLVAATLAGVGFATGLSTSTSTTSTTTTTTTTTPEDGEGCTPGFWKTHPESWTGFSTEDTLEDVFDVPNSLGLDDTTLLEALDTGGGGVNALLRHAVAALLNSASPDVEFGLTTAQVIAETNEALASGDYESTKDMFEALNEQSAPGFCD
jgi:hypothetical protein